MPDRLLELSWRPRLTEAEAAEVRGLLAARPEWRAAWEAEAGLNRALERLPEAPLSSNFTARVLEAVELEASAEARQARAGWRRGLRQPGWVLKLGFAAALVCAGVVSWHQVQVARRLDALQSMAAVTGVTSMPSPDVLRDFDAIRALDRAPRADEELLAIMESAAK